MLVVFAALIYAAASLAAVLVLLLILCSVNNLNTSKQKQREGYHPSSWHLHN